jgi:Flp pilus assembly protein TadG
MTSSRSQSGQDGQALVIFVLSLVAIIAMTGLILDAGGAFAQRRDEQNVADLASIAGATAYANTSGTHAARAAAASDHATATATKNGYTSSAATNTSVSVAVDANPANGSVAVTATIQAPHRNYFAGIVGQTSWDVGATATAIAGIPNAAVGAMPILFNEDAFLGNATTNRSAPGILYQEPGSGTLDVPQDATTFNWTVFCTAIGAACNADSQNVRQLISQGGESTVVQIGDAIGPLNAGSHTTLFTAMDQWVGEEFPVAIVSDAGELTGWAMFHLTAIDGGANKVIQGYFAGPLNPEKMSIATCRAGQLVCNGVNFASYTIKLIN